MVLEWLVLCCMLQLGCIAWGIHGQASQLRRIADALEDDRD